MKRVSLSKPRSSFDFAIPYDIMVGVWSGMATEFDGHGELLSLTPSLVAIYWKERSALLSYRQLEEIDFPIKFPKKGAGGNLRVKALPKLNKAQGNRRLLQTTMMHFDLHVDGKHCDAKVPKGMELQSVEGTETCPGIYIFHLRFKGGRYYNNQYFIDPDERHIIGPFIEDGNPQVSSVVAQTFARVSYDVPQHLQSEVGKS